MSRKGRNILALFARLPGRSGDGMHARVYRETLHHQILEHQNRPYELVVYVSPSSKVRPFTMAYGVETRPQRGADLGERMARCFDELTRRAARVAIAATDVPGLTWRRVQRAFRLVSDRRVVLGPSPDGGYYLIAARRKPEVFENIPWGTREVLPRTLERLQAKGCRWRLLSEEWDIDE